MDIPPPPSNIQLPTPYALGGSLYCHFILSLVSIFFETRLQARKQVLIISFEFWDFYCLISERIQKLHNRTEWTAGYTCAHAYIYLFVKDNFFSSVIASHNWVCSVPRGIPGKWQQICDGQMEGKLFINRPFKTVLNPRGHLLKIYRHKITRINALYNSMQSCKRERAAALQPACRVVFIKDSLKGEITFYDTKISNWQAHASWLI